jgi:uncharacterized protein
MTRYVSIAIAALIILAIAVFAWQASVRNSDSPSSGNNAPSAKIGNRNFKLYVAETNKDKEVGLSKYDKLNDDQGMLFDFGSDGYYSFWMKKMKFPIDIIYINDNKIVTIHKNVSPPKNEEELKVYTSDEPADRVIEVKAGITQRYNLKEGDSVTLSNI